MSSISRDEVSRVAELARIDLTPQETERLAGELDVIVDAVAQISSVASKDIPPTSNPQALVNVFREDVPEAPMSIEDVMEGAPAHEDGRFAVPQILGEE